MRIYNGIDLEVFKPVSGETQIRVLSDNRPEGVYVIATCNDISSLPPEWVRPGRWDSAPFFIDLPDDEQREAIFAHYAKEYDVYGDCYIGGWSGAEIESVCRIAAMMDIDVDDAAAFVIPISKTMDTEIKKLREWAKDRTIPCSEIKEEIVKRRAVKL